MARDKTDKTTQELPLEGNKDTIIVDARDFAKVISVLGYVAARSFDENNSTESRMIAGLAAMAPKYAPELMPIYEDLKAAQDGG